MERERRQELEFELNSEAGRFREDAPNNEYDAEGDPICRTTESGNVVIEHNSIEVTIRPRSGDSPGGYLHID